MPEWTVPHPVTINEEKPLALHGTGPKISLTINLSFSINLTQSVGVCIPGKVSFLVSYRTQLKLSQKLLHVFRNYGTKFIL